MQRKIDAGQDHEHDGHEVDGRTAKMTNRQVMCGEAADRHRREGMADRIKQAHAGQPVSQPAKDRESQVEVPERLCGLCNTRRQLVVFDRPRCFSPIQLHAADAEHWQNSDGENDDSHAAQPLQLLAIVKYRTGQGIEAGEYSCARRCEARHRFKHGIGERHGRHFCEKQR